MSDATRLSTTSGRTVGRRAALWLVAALSLATVVASVVGTPARASARAEGLVALYTFNEGRGSVVHDRSGSGHHLDLRIRRGDRVRWSPAGLAVADGAGVSSARSAGTLLSQLRRTHAATVEAWLRPIAGSRATLLRHDAVPGPLTQVVYTRSRRGAERLYVAGHLFRRGQAARSLTSWDARQRLLLARAGHGAAPWKGVLRQVSIFNRALTPAEVRARGKRSRPRPTPTPATPTTPTTPTASATPAPTPVPSQASQPPVTDTTVPKLIKHGWDIPTPQFVHDHVAEMEKLPFDGLTITIPGLGDKVQRQTPVTYAQFAAALAPLRTTRFARLTNNFAMAYASPAGSVFADWSVPISNFANLARAAREAGLAGIVYDNEEYFGAVADYPGTCPGHTLAECQTQARLRGHQVMDAMRAVWPDITVMSMYGPWVSEPQTYDALAPLMTFNDVSFANELMGPFFVGLAESAAGTAAHMIDGGEIYTARSTAQFSAITSWQTSGLPARSSAIPRPLAPLWAATVYPGVGVYDQPYIGIPMDVGVWESTIRNALVGGAQYVWLYTERYDWWGSGWPATRVPQSWIDAVSAARAAAGR
jgi:hypothetical protein